MCSYRQSLVHVLLYYFPVRRPQKAVMQIMHWTHDVLKLITKKKQTFGPCNVVSCESLVYNLTSRKGIAIFPRLGEFGMPDVDAPLSSSVRLRIRRSWSMCQCVD